MSPVSTFLLLAGAVMGVFGAIKMIPHMRQFEAEGRRIGFDFFSKRYFPGLLRPEILPKTMQESGRKARFYGMLFLWPAFGLMLAAFILDRFSE